MVHGSSVVWCNAPLCGAWRGCYVRPQSSRNFYKQKDIAGPFPNNCNLNKPWRRSIHLASNSSLPLKQETSSATHRGGLGPSPPCPGLLWSEAVLTNDNYVVRMRAVLPRYQFVIDS